MNREKFTASNLFREIVYGSDGCNSGRCCIYSRMGPHGLWYCTHPDADRFAVVVSAEPGRDFVCSAFVPLGREEAPQ